MEHTNAGIVSVAQWISGEL